VLFNAPLAVEKALKAAFMEQHGKGAPKTHDLLQVVLHLDRPCSDNEKRQLSRLTEFAITARDDDPP